MKLELDAQGEAAAAAPDEPQESPAIQSSGSRSRTSPPEMVAARSWWLRSSLDSTAHCVGLQPGMTATEVDGRPLRTASWILRSALHRAAPGSEVLLKVEAGGSRLLRALPIPLPEPGVAG